MTIPSLRYALACGVFCGVLRLTLRKKLSSKMLDKEYPIVVSRLPLVSVLILKVVVLSGGTSAVLTVNPPILSERCIEVSEG